MWWTVVVAASMVAQTGTAKPVDRVIDGDTIVMAELGSVRLLGIDAPEIGSPSEGRCATLAKEFLAKLIGESLVEVVFDGARKDSYGRWLGYVQLSDGTIANRELISNGWARVYRAWWFSQEGEYLRLEQQARARELGVWATGAAACSAASANVVYHGNRRSRVFHAPGCAYYNCANCTVEFKRRRDAEAAGFRAHRDCVR